MVNRLEKKITRFNDYLIRAFYSLFIYFKCMMRFYLEYVIKIAKNYCCSSHIEKMILIE